MEASYSYLFKYILLGDAGVGKSNLLLQFVDGKFRVNYDLTIGVQFGSKVVQRNGEHIKLQIWDTSGNENFRSITRSYYRGSIGAILVYDVTNRKSFDSISRWLQEIKQNNEKVTIMLVGNKIDLGSKREVSYNQGAAFASQHNLKYMECSAKNRDQTQQIFMVLTNEIVNKIEDYSIDVNDPAGIGIKVGKEKAR